MCVCLPTSTIHVSLFPKGEEKALYRLAYPPPVPRISRLEDIFSVIEQISTPAFQRVTVDNSGGWLFHEELG